MSSHPYHEQVDIMNTVKLRELMEGLPEYTRIYFRGIEPNTSSRTRIAYAYDLHVFFEYLIQKHPAFQGRQITELPVELLDEVKAVDIENYMEYLKFYHCGDGQAIERVNQERGIIRKIASLKTFYNYFFRKEMIQTNPAALVLLPKQHEKEIVRLDIDEVAILLDQVESGEKLTKRQQE